MGSPKILREAKAAVAAIEAKRKELLAAIAEANKGRKPLADKVAAIAKRRRRVAVIKNLAGSYYVGSLADLKAEIRHVFKDGEKPTAKKVREGLETGGIKIGAGGYGQSYSLKGLLPRLRIIDKPTFRAYQRKVAARKRLETLLVAAKNAEAAAFDVTFKAGVKPAPELVIAGIVEEAIAVARLDAEPEPHQLRHELSRLAGDDEWSPMFVAKQHLEHVKSGSTEPCPCRNDRAAREQAVRDRDEAARRATLPTRMIGCPTHGRRRMAYETPERSVFSGNVSGVEWPADLAQRWIQIPVGHCPKGHSLYLVSELLAAREKAAKKVTRIKKSGGPAAGETIAFTCPNCGVVASSEVDEDEEGELRVGCSNCEAEPLASAVVVVKKATKAA